MAGKFYLESSTVRWIMVVLVPLIIQMTNQFFPGLGIEWDESMREQLEGYVPLVLNLVSVAGCAGAFRGRVKADRPLRFRR